MPDDGYTSAWDGADSDFQSTAASSYTRPPMRSLDVQDAASTSNSHSVASPARLSSESNDASSSSKWRDNNTAIDDESRDSVSETVNLIEPGFDEDVLRSLCEMDVRCFADRPAPLSVSFS